MLENIAEQTGMTPQALLNRPTLEDHLQFPYRLFRELQSERENTFGGVGALKFTSYLKYAELYQFSRLDTQELWEVVKSIDDTYRGLQQERQAAASAKKGSGSPSLKKPSRKTP